LVAVAGPVPDPPPAVVGPTTAGFLDVAETGFVDPPLVDPPFAVELPVPPLPDPGDVLVLESAYQKQVMITTTRVVNVMARFKRLYPSN
jgi:hypothetical protein